MKSIITKLAIAAGFIFLLSSCDNYGKKIKIDGTKAEVYYKDGASEADARSVGNFLKKEGFLGNEKPASVQVTKEGDRDIVRFVYDKDYFDKTPGVEDVFKTFGAKMSKEIFYRRKVDIALADKHFKDFKKIPYDEAVAKALDAPKEVVFNKNDFDHDAAGGVDFYWKGISDDESKRIADYIVQNGAFAGGTAEIYMTKDGDHYLLRFPVKEEFLNDASIIAAVEKVSKEIKDNVFPNNAYTFQMTDIFLKPVKTFDY